MDHVKSGRDADAHLALLHLQSHSELWIYFTWKQNKQNNELIRN